MTSFQWADDNVSSSSSITPKFVLPETHRPNLEDISRETIPVIDMNEDHDILVQKIAEACENFGFFQITNHGVKEELCAKVLDVITTFFELSHEKKSHLVSSDHMEDGKIFKYYVKTEEDKIIPMWSEALFHTWDPVDHSYTSNLPQDPTCYRETIAEYGMEIGPLMNRLLSLMSQGLGLDKNRLQSIIGENAAYSAQAHYYPACSNPELTLGLRPHFDLKVLTVILQEGDVTGLHVRKQDKWMAVDPVPGALCHKLGRANAGLKQ
ncbi:protein DOWNY MILDEW RESISTANCE 6-like [Beta vulgaris subsp. vulgaris]|uniref:protein DOWNY MILDEW RESISTANCE 6-like n=1 Tax=Beta vulgaris subsp. vulgaris TaxID=3555 RepID=UPI002548230B|nr:protein DOWNY MILDEW RESISTANCE 6-like [Beta vulgaris subsp. vulgaris]